MRDCASSVLINQWKASETCLSVFARARASCNLQAGGSKLAGAVYWARKFTSPLSFVLLIAKAAGGWQVNVVE